MRRPARRSLELPPRQPLRGAAKLEAALQHFGIDVDDRVVLDVGAAAGGFVTTLLQHGARAVYAVDAGHGQLLGSLRQDPRVINLENTNVAALTPALVPATVEVVTVDVSYLALAAAVAQLDQVRFAPGAELVGLVKPMFELRLPTAPVDDERVAAAVERAVTGVSDAGWIVTGTMPSPVTGSRGAREALLHARRA